MAFKYFFITVVTMIIKGEASVPVAAPLSDSTYDPVPQYYFGYDVQDALTGDSKSQVETRNGDVVLGQYSLNDPDGTRRIVDYSADDINGFNAVVRKAPVAVATPVVAAAAPTPAVEPAAVRTVSTPLIVARTSVAIAPAVPNLAVRAVATPLLQIRSPIALAQALAPASIQLVAARSPAALAPAPAPLAPAREAASDRSDSIIVEARTLPATLSASNNLNRSAAPFARANLGQSTQALPNPTSLPTTPELRSAPVPSASSLSSLFRNTLAPIRGRVAQPVPNANIPAEPRSGSQVSETVRSNSPAALARNALETAPAPVSPFLATSPFAYAAAPALAYATPLLYNTW